MPRSVAVLAVLLSAALTTAFAAPGAAVAAPLPAPAVGADVSYHQCGEPLPPVPAFAIVGVNDGVATGANPCFAQQLAWARGAAGGAGAPKVDFYLNTANPGPVLASWWPTKDRTRRGTTVHAPSGHCTGGATTACAYVYGASIALDDTKMPGVPSNAGTRWWLDVETANTWSGSTTRNRAVLEGMTRTLTAAHHTVGLYALSGEFRDLIGSVPTSSTLSSLPSWLAGAGGIGTAANRCTATALTRGRTLLAQVPARAPAVDLDVVCRPFAAAPHPRITGGHGVGAVLTAKAGTWRPTQAHLAYRWNRDGHAIAKATGRTHRVVRADAGHRVTVTVTATISGYSRTATTSRSVSTHR